jgi:hypothetical protein
MSYEFSVWYVPYNYQDFMDKYNIIHIPHVTYTTNLKTIEECHAIVDNIPKEININFANDAVIFSRMYKNDPLHSYGWWIDVDDLKFHHRPHMTIEYFNDSNKLHNHKLGTYTKPERTKCFLAISDTNSMDPSDWTILGRKS